ncbi:L-lysine 2,3-aminomutase [uncultured Desulfobacterium sp.]|uniref:L-lysine 2,3-aminomutase n=1 Tax=uncultured Desulfobacterium sp. TaxID=201089 RepID=A0A445N2Q3_9BACT|nr:L-lysine 2,3-aminomutase [uncultured Desulfobacterium sp.]
MAQSSEHKLTDFIRHSDRRPLWKQLLSASATRVDDISATFEVKRAEIQRVIERYPMRVNSYYLGLIRQKNDAIYRQCIPSLEEVISEEGLDDPLNEEAMSPVPGLTHRYPDRVLFLVSSYCAVYCRFCNRKRKVGRRSMVTPQTIKDGLEYIRNHSEIRDVLLSGGDPLMLDNKDLYDILNELRSMGHVEIIRIGTRAPCTLPQRVTSELAAMLSNFHPLYINTHFNHPDEITPESSLACRTLADYGIPLGCQTVLLKGVNDDPVIIKTLMQKLLTIRVRPYYLFQADLAKGTSHFWTPLDKGLEIMAGLYGHTSGLCAPHFAIDLPGGAGKVPIIPEHIVGKDDAHLLIRDYQGQVHRYPLMRRK